MNFKRLNKQKGIGLLELMLAIAIIAVLLIMATRYYQSSQRATLLNQADNIINAVNSAATQYSAAQGNDFSGFNTDNVIDSGSVPKALIDGAGTDAKNKIAMGWWDSYSFWSCHRNLFRSVW